MLLSFLRALFIVSALTIFPLHAQWTTPVNLPVETGNKYDIQIGVDSFGNTTAVWQSQRIINSTTYYAIQSTIQEFGANWGPIEDVYTPNPIEGGNLKMVVDPFGNVTLLCYKDLGGGKKGFMSLFKPFGGAWQGPVTLSIADDIGVGNDPYKMAVDSQGNIAVIWNRHDSNGWQVRAALKPFGSDWLPTQVLIAGSYQYINMNIGFDTYGNAIAAWEELSSPEWPIYASVKPFDSNTWQTPIKICNNGTDSLGAPNIISDSSGNVYVVWAANNDEETFLLSALRPAGSSTWQPVESIPTNSEGGVYSDSYSAVNSNGTIVAVWQRATNPSEIMWSYHAFGGEWQSPMLLSSAGQPTSNSQITVDEFGNATAVWAEFDGTHWLVKSVYKPVGSTTWQVPVIIEVSDIDPSTISGFTVDLVQDPNGNMTALWSASIASGAIIHTSNSYAPPKITSFSPSIGPRTGGNEVVIQGHNFIDVSSVVFGTTSTPFTVNSPTSITVTAPSGSGLVDVAITSNWGTSLSSSLSKYGYYLSSPTHVKGKLIKHAFCSQVEFFHQLTWRASPDQSVTKYLVYQNGRLIKTVRADQPLALKVRNIKNKKRVEYTIVAHDDSDLYSEPVAISVK